MTQAQGTCLTQTNEVKKTLKMPDTKRAKSESSGTRFVNSIIKVDLNGSKIKKINKK